MNSEFAHDLIFPSQEVLPDNESLRAYVLQVTKVKDTLVEKAKCWLEKHFIFKGSFSMRTSILLESALQEAIQNCLVHNLLDIHGSAVPDFLSGEWASNEDEFRRKVLDVRGKQSRISLAVDGNDITFKYTLCRPFLEHKELWEKARPDSETPDVSAADCGIILADDEYEKLTALGGRGFVSIRLFFESYQCDNEGKTFSFFRRLGESDFVSTT